MLHGVDAHESVDRHLTVMGLPLVVLFEAHSADQAGDGGPVEEDARDIRPPLYSLFSRSVRLVQSRPVRDGKRHASGEVMLGLLYDRGELGPAYLDLI